MSKRSLPFTSEEVEYLVDLVGKVLQNTSKLTQGKRILKKMAWDDIATKFVRKFPHHTRRGIQKKWLRLKGSFSSLKTLETPVSGSDVHGRLPPEAEEERASRMSRLRKDASLAQNSGCLDKISAVLEGRYATGMMFSFIQSSYNILSVILLLVAGRHAVVDPSMLSTEVDEDGDCCADDDDDDDDDDMNEEVEESRPQVRQVDSRTRRRGSPKKDVVEAVLMLDKTMAERQDKLLQMMERITAAAESLSAGYTRRMDEEE